MDGAVFFPPTISDEARDLMQSLLRTDPRERLGVRRASGWRERTPYRLDKAAEPSSTDPATTSLARANLPISTPSLRPWHFVVLTAWLSSQRRSPWTTNSSTITTGNHLNPPNKHEVK
ncbi:Protein kinase-like domain [Phytophthora cactorum]|nr:Protein kinase-like domain [Phytophthora cactorum]